MKKLLMLGVYLSLLSPVSVLAEEDGTSGAYQEAYEHCSKLADEQAVVSDDGNMDGWDSVLADCLQEKGFTAPSDDEDHDHSDHDGQILEDTAY